MTVAPSPFAPGTQALALPPADALSLSERIHGLHAQVRRIAPSVDRMACALYDAEMDMLKTFVNSTQGSEPLRAYQYPLSKSPSLLRLAQQRESRVLRDIPTQVGEHDNEHTRWVRAQGYRSSFTLPLFHQGTFEGFLFFDSHEPDAFTPTVVDQLQVYSQLVAVMISHEVTALQALLGSVRVARDFAHLRDVETGCHLDRMSRYARLVARGLVSSHGLSDEFVEQIFLFAPLHDIGKIGVPDAVLLKPGVYTAEEREVMRTHVSKGVTLIERLVSDFQLRTVSGIGLLRQIVAHHHEFLDGSGYPAGLRGDAIPLAARIITVADIFDALTSRRIYKTAWPIEESLATLDEMVAAGKLDPACVQALHDDLPGVREIMGRFNEG